LVNGKELHKTSKPLKEKKAIKPDGVEGPKSWTCDREKGGTSKKKKGSLRKGGCGKKRELIQKKKI